MLKKYYQMVLIIFITFDLAGCGGGNDVASTSAGATSTMATAPTPSQLLSPISLPIRNNDVWQNPSLSPNPGSNIHNDSYLSDSYSNVGPIFKNQPTVEQIAVTEFLYKDPATNKISLKIATLGECAALAFDASGNIQTVCAGIPLPGAAVVNRSVITLDSNTMEILAFYPFTKDNSGSTSGEVDFGGAGYFYQDNQYRLVVAMPNGHVNVLQRSPNKGAVDNYIVAKDYNLIDTNGPIAIPKNLTALSLYALLPDKVGNIWFTIAEGIVGYISPNGTVSSLDLNDLNNTGTQQKQVDGEYQTIANSHAIDEGDSANGSSGVYILSSHALYRFSVGSNGKPVISWSAAYERGPGMKSGQVSWGSGTSPTIFRMGSRRFVTIVDNATKMNVNVYRVEATLLTGEQRLFAQIKPFGDNTLVSDENSLIVAAGLDGNSVDIYAENNYGNESIQSTMGRNVTQPGFARMNLKADGSITVASVNSTIAVPSIVSKISLASNIVYTYNKTADGWYLTGLDGTDLNKVIFSSLIGKTPAYNNYFSGLALGPDEKSVWFGTLFGVTRVQ